MCGGIVPCSRKPLYSVLAFVDAVTSSINLSASQTRLKSDQFFSFLLSFFLPLAFLLISNSIGQRQRLTLLQSALQTLIELEIDLEQSRTVFVLKYPFRTDSCSFRQNEWDVVAAPVEMTVGTMKKRRHIELIHFRKSPNLMRHKTR